MKMKRPKIDHRPCVGDVRRATFRVELAPGAVRAIDEDERTVELAFSSEEPVERFFGTEILDHTKDSVRLDRMSGGAALLVNHDSDQQVGVVESARVDPDRRGRAVVRFGRSEYAQEIFQDVVDGIRSLVSVGYRIHDVVFSRLAEGGEEARVVDWEPLEVSLVAVPADASVGVGRGSEHTGSLSGDAEMPDETNDALAERDDDQSPAEGDVGATQSRDETETSEDTSSPEPDRGPIDERIRAIGREMRMSSVAEQLISVRGSVADMEAAVRNAIITRRPEPISSAPSYRVSGGMPLRRRRLKAFKELGEEAAYRSGMWARAHLFNDANAQRWCRDHHMRVATTAAISSGGALVPDELSQAIIDLREQYGMIRSLARVVPMNSETLTVPRRVGGVTAYFVGQEQATTESDKTWDQVQLVARELSALSRFSRAYAEDAVIDVAEDLANEMAYAFAEKEDDCALNGDGTSTYGGIMGIRTILIDGSHTAGYVEGASGIDTFAEVDSADLANVRAKLPAYAESGAVWLFSKSGKNTVIDPILAAGGGNTKVDLAGSLVDGYLGDPVVVSQKMPTSTGDLSDVIMFLYGDFSLACTMGDRAGFSVQVLTERYAEFRQIGVISTERFDFVAHDLGDTSNAGPVVGFLGE